MGLAGIGVSQGAGVPGGQGRFGHGGVDFQHPVGIPQVLGPPGLAAGKSPESVPVVSP